MTFDIGLSSSDIEKTQNLILATHRASAMGDNDTNNFQLFSNEFTPRP